MGYSLSTGAVLFTLVLLSAVLVPLASAQGSDDAETRLRVTPGATCLEPVSMARRIEHWLGRSLPPPDAPAQLNVRGSEADPRSVTVEVLVEGETRATREFHPGPAACDDLMDAVAIAATMMLQALPPEAWQATPPPEPEPEPPAQPPPAPVTEKPAPELAPPPAPTPAPEEPEEEAAPRPLRLSAGAIGHFWPARGGSGGGGALDLGLEVGKRFELRVGGLGAAWPSRPLADTQESYDSTLLTASLQACTGQPARPGTRIRACGGVLGGILRARLADSERVPVAVLTAGLEAQWRLSIQWRLVVALSLAYRPRQVTVTAQDASGDPVGTTRLPKVGALLGLGVRGAFFAKHTGSWDMKEQ